MASLSSLHPPIGARNTPKRVGRGPGSGYGKTSSRGHKGLKARSGGGRGAGFEGGQMPLQRRLPKRGFTSIFKTEYQIVNVADLNTFESQTVVTPSVLQEAGKIKSLKKPVKVLGQGDISVPITIKADKFSQTAREKITSAGGNVEEGPS